MEAICFSDILIPPRSRAPLTHLLTCHKLVWMKLNACERLEVDDDSKSKYFTCEIFYWKLAADRPLICFSPAGDKAVRWNSPHPGCHLKPSTGWLRNKKKFYFWLFGFSFSVRALGYLWLGFLQGQKAFWELEMTLYSSLVLSSLVPQSTSLGSALETQQLDPEEGACMCCQTCSFDDLEWFFKVVCHFRKFYMS